MSITEKITTRGITILMQQEEDGTYTVVIYMENQRVQFEGLSREAADRVYYRMGGDA